VTAFLKRSYDFSKEIICELELNVEITF
jgi:hypothetical protein